MKSKVNLVSKILKTQGWWRGYTQWRYQTDEWSQ